MLQDFFTDYEFRSAASQPAHWKVKVATIRSRNQGRMMNAAQLCSQVTAARDPSSKRANLPDH